jgi:nitroimidazol reductase NimA-like FMN-containing flavoprotein (pyridoxamine 5'-phosphate oxidase superfamily)
MVKGTGEIMDPVKIPKMQKAEYDSLIKRQYVSRIAFGACEHPSIAPFMYVFDGKYLFSFPQNTAGRSSILKATRRSLWRLRNTLLISPPLHL